MTTNPHRINFFRSTRIFAHLPDAALREVIAGFRPRVYARHEILFLQGDEARNFYLMSAGRVRLYSISDQGREFTFFIVRARQAFDLPSVFDGKPHPVSASALSDTRVYVASLTHIQEMADRYPPLYRALARQLSAATRRIADIASDLALTDVATRLARLLLVSSQSQGEPTPEGILLTLDLSHSEIATLLGTAREVVSRTFRHMEREGLVLRTQRGILIRDELKLADIAHMREKL